MASKINNLATLNYTSGGEDLSTDSNIASINIQGSVDVRKNALENGYRLGESVTYHLFVTNTTDDTLSNITIVDNLGKYTLASTTDVVPLTYVKPSKLFINDLFVREINGTIQTADQSLRFEIDQLDVGATMMISYKVLANEFAPATSEPSNIVNTVSVTINNVPPSVTATNTLPLELYTDIVVQKTMSPDTVADGDDIIYAFDIQNYGTRAATAARLKDFLNPIPTINDVYVDTVQQLPASYSLNETSGEFLYPSATTSNYTIAPATFTRDSETGIVSITPTISTVKIYATI